MPTVSEGRWKVGLEHSALLELKEQLKMGKSACGIKVIVLSAIISSLLHNNCIQKALVNINILGPMLALLKEVYINFHWIR